MNIPRDWNEFWFAPRPSGPLGLYRVIFGLLVLAWAGLLAPDLFTWYSQRGVIPLAAMKIFDGPGYYYSVDLLAHVVTPGWIVFWFVLLIVVALLVTVGFCTRLSTIVLWVLLASFEHRNEIILNSGDIFLRLMAFYLMLAPAGAACSVDRLIRVWRGKESAGDPPLIVPWAQRLIQIQICIVYLSTVLGKVTGSLWQDGTAIYYPLHMAEMVRFWVPFVGFHAHINQMSMYLINILTYGTLATELAMGTLVWVPRLRGYVLTMGTLLHIGIEYALNIPLFSALMISAYLNFMPNEWIARFVSVLSLQFGRRPLTLRYAAEGRVPALAAVLGRLDSLHLVAFEPFAERNRKGATSDAVLEVVDSNGKVYTGFAALRRAARRMPALWVKVPFYYLPGITKLGDRVLARIAASSPRRSLVADAVPVAATAD